MRILYFIFSLFLLTSSCNQKQSVNILSLRDSVLNKHLKNARLSPDYDTLNYDFKLLKAYVKNDTAFLQKHLTDQRNSEVYQQTEFYKSYAVYPDSCIHLKNCLHLNLKRPIDLHLYNPSVHIE